jgi:hypothetical protein
MSISSKITIQWTPSPNALTQSVERALVSTGPWTTLVSGLGPTVNSYDDITVVDNPQTLYYYRVLTYCDAESAPTPSAIKFAYSNNCATPTNPYPDETVFGLWSTNAGLITSFNYYDHYADIRGLTALKTVTSPAGKIRVVCHKCGQTVQPVGVFAQYGDVSYLSNQGNIAQYLPASPSGLGGIQYNNRGNVTRKIRFGNSIIDNVAAHFGNGSGNIFNQVVLSSGTYTLKNHTQLRLGKYIFGTTTDQTADLNALNSTNLYVAVSMSDYKCHIYIYQAQRNSNLDITAGGQTMLGFNLSYVSFVINNNYAVYSIIDSQILNFNDQPNANFKFFNL